MSWFVERLNALNRARQLVVAARRACPVEQYEEWLVVSSAVDMEIEERRKRVAELCAPWFDDSAFRRCTCYVLPHADDCGALLGITKSGKRVYAEEVRLPDGYVNPYAPQRPRQGGAR